MLSRKEAIQHIINSHGPNCIYIVSTGYISRDAATLYPNAKNIFYMKGSMGLAPSIGLGIALNTEKDVVVINGDASLLMHYGSTFTTEKYARNNFYHYVLKNGCHESVGGFPCAEIGQHPTITNILICREYYTPPRIEKTFEQNTNEIMEELKNE